jgi:hypothetical protein
MPQKFKKWLTFTLRWGIAVVGIWLVIRQMSMYDRVWVIEGNRLVPQKLQSAVGSDVREGQSFRLHDGREVAWDQTASKPERKEVAIKTDDGKEQARLIGVDLRGDLNKKPQAARFYVVTKDAGGVEQGRWVSSGCWQSGTTCACRTRASRSAWCTWPSRPSRCC